MTTTRSRRYRLSQPMFDDSRYVTAVACGACLDVAICGGLRIPGGLFGCQVTCCGEPDACERVCRRKSDFKSRVQEIGGLRFENLKIEGQPYTGVMPAVVPLIYHGASRTVRLDVPFAAVKLAALYDRRTGGPRYATRAALCDALKITEGTTIIVSGIDDDPAVERWWEIGRVARRHVIDNLVGIGIGLITTPNFSVCVDWPRPGDLAAMMRITRCYEELADAGMPAALHVNGRTPHDFERWGILLRRTSGISHVAYEFSTGTAYAGRLEQHVAWLKELAAGVGRPLGLVMTGDSGAALMLADAFDTVTWLESTSFMKTMHRQVAARAGNGEIEWISRPTGPGEDLAGLLTKNVEESRAMHVMRRAV